MEKLKSSCENTPVNCPSLPLSQASLTRRKAAKAGYVLLNPKPDQIVKQGDLVYVILPAIVDVDFRQRIDDDGQIIDDNEVLQPETC